jgi:two-component system, NtrC family, response regulator HydG
MKNILVIDDDKDLRFLLKKLLTTNGFICHEVGTGEKAMEVLQTNSIDLVFCDLNLKKEDGKDVLVAIKEIDSSLPVIIMTGYTNVRTAVEVMQLGATDYLIKPLIPAEIISTIHRTLEKPNERPVVTAKTPVEVKFPEQKLGIDLPYVLSPNESFQKILKEIDLVAPTDYSVIIYGESGSGKEAFANEIHKRSKRSSKPFLAIDCGALSKELSGSILFGHEKGAFTGAMSQKVGAFESAEGGTVFLDEVSNLPYEIQVSLLRVMQERKTRRVGGTVDIKIDVRIIVASNKKLWDEAKAGKFREDLYHRFNEFSINVLPLRERQRDIIFYAEYFLGQSNQELKKNISGFSIEAMTSLLEYRWPGNLRELKNLVKRCVLIAEGEKIGIQDLPSEITNEVSIFDQPLAPRTTVNENYFVAKAEDDYRIIMETLKQTGFNKKKTGKILNMDLKTLNGKIKVFADMKGFSLKF